MNSFSLYEGERYVSPKGAQVEILHLGLYHNGSGYVAGVVFKKKKEIMMTSEKYFCENYMPVGGDF